MSFLDPGGTWFGPCLAAGACAAGISYDNDGFVGGAQAGWNWQFDQFVLGVEADIQYSDMNGGGLIATAVAPFAVSTFNSTSDIDWLGTLRARAGFAFDRALIYATGGLAYGGVKDSFRWGFPALGQVYWGGGNNTEWGWTAGGGFEYAMTDNVIVGAEILYFDLGSTSVVGTPGPLFVPLPPVGTSLTANYDHDGVIARARISYKF